MGFSRVQVNVANTDFLKAQLFTPVFDILRELTKINIDVLFIVGARVRVVLIQKCMITR